MALRVVFIDPFPIDIEGGGLSDSRGFFDIGCAIKVTIC